MSALLAKTRLTKLGDAKFMRGLTESMDREGENLLIQSHYAVEGSLEERARKIFSAFRTWRYADGNDDYRYSSVLGTDLGEITFYTSDWYEGEPKYYTVNYTISDAGEVTIDAASIQKADVAIVVKKLGLDQADPAEGVPHTPTIVAPGEVVAEDAKPEEETSAEETPKLEGEGEPAPVDGEVVADETKPEDDAVPPVVADETKPEQTQSDGLPTKLDLLLQSKPEALELIQSVACDRQYGNRSACKVLSQSAETIDGKEHVVLNCIVTRANIINTQGQVYTDDLWQGLVPVMNEQAQAGKFTGKLEHPEDKGLGTVAVRWLPDFQMQGDDVHARAVVVQTSHGKDLQAMLDAGVVPDFSTVGFGTTREGTFLGQAVRFVNKDFFCTRIDAVKHGSSVGSTTTGSTTETIVPTVQTQSAKDPGDEQDVGDEPKPGAEAEPISDPASNEDKNEPTEDDTTMSEKTQSTQTPLTPEQRIAADAQKANFALARTQNVNEARAKLSPEGFRLYEQSIAEANTPEEFYQSSDGAMTMLERMFKKPEGDGTLQQGQGDTWSPGIFLKQSKETLAPKNEDELFRRMTEHIPDHWAHGDDIEAIVQSDDAARFLSPRHACIHELKLMAKHKEGAFNGPAAVQTILALEQGNIGRAQQITESLQQAMATGATTAAGNNNPGGAPLSAPYIFQIVTRAWPMMIMDEIASVQPLDRPAGKIFYEDFFRVIDGTNNNDKRMDINTSANPFDFNFSNNNTEGSQPAMLRLNISSIDVSASNKKLNAEWTVEQMQDLEAYHGLDSESLLLNAIAKELALEKNGLTLNGMLGGATGSARTYGAVMPASGWTQEKWDEYMSVYLNRVMIDIMQKRNNPVTHIVMGTEAFFYLSKAMRWTVDPTSDTTNVRKIAGVTFNNMVTLANGDRVRIMVTNIWAPNSAASYKALVFRRGDSFGDAPFVYSPYKTFTSPAFFDPNKFTTIQGMMTRDAYTVVVPEAMGVLTVNPVGTGVPL